jgi:hypothetical protein
VADSTGTPRFFGSVRLLPQVHPRLHNIAGPLTQLLKKEAFVWSPEATAAFTALKQVLTTAPVLQLSNFDKPFIVNCDASGTGFGAALHQEAGPIAFYSRPVAPQHSKLAAYECELIGLVKAVRHWRPYLWTCSFIVRTDHYALKFLLDQRLSTIPQHAWVSKLSGYDFIVEFNPGRTNTVADALSRCNEDQASVHLLSTPTFQFFDDFRKEAASHPDVVKLKQQIEQGMALPVMGISLCTWYLWRWFFSASWTTFKAARAAPS